MTVAEQQQQQQQRLIDGFLQRYLGLLDDYTTLRRQLCDLQASVYQHIARANYTAERGLRYGSDHYDGRMRAARRLSIRKDEAGVGVYAVGLAAAHPGSQTPPAAVDRQAQPWTEASSAAANPLRWFGLLAPAPLRAAQEFSVEVVERVIPRLLSVRAEMLHLEIEMRRARELRAKEDVLPGGEMLSLA